MDASLGEYLGALSFHSFMSMPMLIASPLITDLGLMFYIELPYRAPSARLYRTLPSSFFFSGSLPILLPHACHFLLICVPVSFFAG